MEPNVIFGLCSAGLVAMVAILVLILAAERWRTEKERQAAIRRESRARCEAWAEENYRQWLREQLRRVGK